MLAIAQPYQISSNNQEVTINTIAPLIERDKLEQFLDYLFIKSIQQKSQLTKQKKIRKHFALTSLDNTT
jgi:hypothetical protein